MPDQKDLEDTFDLFSDILLDQLRAVKAGQKELKASDLEVIRKFLSDNHITAVGKKSKPVQIAEQLPYTVPHLKDRQA